MVVTLLHLTFPMFLVSGGIITESDLANYTAAVKPPLQFTMFDNNTAYSPPPPSSGAVYLLILNILNGIVRSIFFLMELLLYTIKVQKNDATLFYWHLTGSQ